MIVWNKETKTNINVLLKDFTDVETYTHGDEVTAVITKKQELIKSLIDYRKDIHYAELPGVSNDHQLWGQ